MENSKISWTHHTFNAWWGCTHASRDNPNAADADPAATSPECDNCYAETTDHRYGGGHWGPGTDRRFFGEAYWNKPLRWNREAEQAGERARVFCSSMADLFEVHTDHPTNVVLASYRVALFGLIRKTPWLDWLLLTKRAENLATMLPWMTGSPNHSDPETGRTYSEPWPNVWVGVTCGVRSSLWRIAELRRVRAAVRFVSGEPLLEHISGKEWDQALGPDIAIEALAAGQPQIGRVDLLIIGDESGQRRRPAQPDWIRTAREAALRHGVTFHLKQWAGADVAGISGVRKGPNGKIHLPMLDGKRWADMPTGPLSPASADAVGGDGARADRARC